MFSYKFKRSRLPLLRFLAPFCLPFGVEITNDFTDQLKSKVPQSGQVFVGGGRGGGTLDATFLNT